MTDIFIEFLKICVLFVVSVGIFYGLVKISNFAYNKIKSFSFIKSNRLFNPKEYIPEEEISSFKQIFFLLMIVVCVINFLYATWDFHSKSINLVLMDFIISLFLACGVDLKTRKGKILLILLIPVNFFNFLMFNSDILYFLNFIHAPVYLYFIKEYFDKFRHYTKSNSLGITIMLLFAIIFISFLITIPAEKVSPLNSLEMVSNAFTSNGYSILGVSSFGRMNAIVLVWSGFFLSGIGTATLTVAIVKRQLNRDFDRLEELIKKNKKN